MVYYLCFLDDVRAPVGFTRVRVTPKVKKLLLLSVLCMARSLKERAASFLVRTQDTQAACACHSSPLQQLLCCSDALYLVVF